METRHAPTAPTLAEEPSVLPDLVADLTQLDTWDELHVGNRVAFMSSTQVIVGTVTGKGDTHAPLTTGHDILVSDVRLGRVYAVETTPPPEPDDIVERVARAITDAHSTAKAAGAPADWSAWIGEHAALWLAREGLLAGGSRHEGL